MNDTETKIAKIIDKIDNLEDLLQDVLPKTDMKHKDEILDICLLLKQRIQTYINEYGLNEGIEI